MRRRQAYAQQDSDEVEKVFASLVVAAGRSFAEHIERAVMESIAAAIVCECGRSFDTEHGLKVHKARAKH